MNILKKITSIVYCLFSLAWLCYGFFGIYTIVELTIANISNKLTDIFQVCLYIIFYLIMIFVQSLCIYKTFIFYFKGKKIKHYVWWIIVNAVLICLESGWTLSYVHVIMFGDLIYTPILRDFLIKPLFSSELFCVLTMINLAIIPKICKKTDSIQETLEDC